MGITEGERHLCEWEFGMASHFVTALFAALAWADPSNLARMSLAFPDQVNAFKRYKEETGYWQRIEGEWRASFQNTYRAAGAPPGILETRPAVPATERPRTPATKADALRLQRRRKK